jgi:uncharacterized cupredoxin-like copper-binding protein
MTIKRIRMTRMPLAAIAFAAALIAVDAGVLAGSGHGTGPSIGEPASTSQASRTVEVLVRDNIYEPAMLKVKKGETIHFVIENEGELLHEFNIGTPSMHVEHQEEMMQMAEQGILTATGVDRRMMTMSGASSMKHDDSNAVLIEPGATEDLTWRFSRDAELEFACNLPGHYEAGMIGHIEFMP